MTETLSYPGGVFVRARPQEQGLVPDPSRIAPMSYGQLHYLGWRLPHQQLALLEQKAHGQLVVFPTQVPLPHQEEWGEMWCMTRDAHGEDYNSVLPQIAVVDWTRAAVQEAMCAEGRPLFASACVLGEESPFCGGEEAFFVRIWNAWPVTEGQAAQFAAAVERSLGSSEWHTIEAALDILSEDWGLGDLKDAELRLAAHEAAEERFGAPVLDAIADKIVEVVEYGISEYISFELGLTPELDGIWQRVLRLSHKHTPEAVSLAADLDGSYAAYREMRMSPWG